MQAKAPGDQTRGALAGHAVRTAIGIRRGHRYRRLAKCNKRHAPFLSRTDSASDGRSPVLLLHPFAIISGAWAAAGWVLEPPAGEGALAGQAWGTLVTRRGAKGVVESARPRRRVGAGAAREGSGAATTAGRAPGGSREAAARQLDAAGGTTARVAASRDGRSAGVAARGTVVAVGRLGLGSSGGKGGEIAREREEDIRAYLDYPLGPPLATAMSLSE
ncbi:hypothetical protein [Oryza sativa Japonica Group]|uniref:Uncharacterized protein n=1 Tax=Oryza sativa subsp. japonica TaxID=39947 RepID=Q5N9T8_ORYSJ|nr:hypothetical protein [Oryza sativa Japonica Group]